MRTRILVLAAVMVCAFGHANATNYYMSPGGSDSDTGASTTHPWASLQQARSHGLAPGDTLFIMGGTYTTAQYFHDLVGAVSGTPGHPIVFKAYGDAPAIFQSVGTWAEEYRRRFFMFYGEFDSQYVTIDGFGKLGNLPYYLKLEAHQDCEAISIQAESGTRHHNYFTIRGVEIDGSNAPTGSFPYPVVLTSANYFDIDNCYIHHAFHPTGELAPGDNSDHYQSTGECLFVKSCEFGKIRNSTFRYGNHGLVALQVIRVAGNHPSRYNQITGNVFDNGWGGGLYLTFDSCYNLVEGNIFAHCGQTTGYLKPPIQLSGSYNTIRRNVFYNPRNQGVAINSQSDAGWNPVCNRNYIYNNTFFKNGPTNLTVYVDNSISPLCSVEHNTIVNNIFYKTDHAQWTECNPAPNQYYQTNFWFELSHSNNDHNWVDPDVYGNYPNTTAWGDNKFWNNCIRYDTRGLAKDTMLLYTSDADNLHAGCYSYNIPEMEADGSGAWANNIGSDPMLKSEDPDTYGISSGWWYLQSGSQCIDAGVAVIDSNGMYVESMYPGFGWAGLSYQGTAPDIGAYEVNGENPSPLIAPPLSSFPGSRR
jgi:hypothetical protein